jgi:hypothetical protein
MTKLEVGGMGIVTGDEMRLLESIVPGCDFKQRKSYDEYYVISDTITLDLELWQLMVLGELFTVTVHADSIEIDRSKSL